MRWGDGAFVLKQSFQHTNRSVKRRTTGFRSVAIPAAVGELLAQKSACKFFIRMAEVAAECEYATVDARLFLPFEEGISGLFDGSKIPIAGSTVPTEGRFEVRDGFFDRCIGGAGASGAQELQRKERREPGRSALATPCAVGFLARENCGAEAFARNACSFDGHG